MPKRAKHIYKRPNGKFEGRYIKEYDENGKPRYGSVYAKTYAEAKQRLENIQAANPAAVSVIKESLRDVLSAHLLTVKNVIKPSTMSVYERYIRNQILPYFGDTKIYSVNREKLQCFVNHLIESGLSERTISAVFSFFKSAIGEKISEKAFDIRLPKKENKEPAVFTADEQKRLETALNEAKPANRIGVLLCLYTGIRLGELCGLTWQDVDFDRSVLLIRRTLQRIKSTHITDVNMCINELANEEKGHNVSSKTKLAFLFPKTASSTRTIPLPMFLLEMLKKHKSEQGGEYVISKNGTFIEPRCFQLRFKRLMAAADIRILSCHALRHSFITRALEKGIDAKTISEIAGHQNASFTLNRYAHALDSHKRKSMEAIASFYADNLQNEHREYQ